MFPVFHCNTIDSFGYAAAFNCRQKLCFSLSILIKQAIYDLVYFFFWKIAKGYLNDFAWKLPVARLTHTSHTKIDEHFEFHHSKACDDVCHVLHIARHYQQNMHNSNVRRKKICESCSYWPIGAIVMRLTQRCGGIAILTLVSSTTNHFSQVNFINHALDNFDFFFIWKSFHFHVMSIIKKSSVNYIVFPCDCKIACTIFFSCRHAKFESLSLEIVFVSNSTVLY